MKLFSRIFLVGTIGATASVASHAETMFVYQDDNGQALLTNVSQPTGELGKFKRRVSKTNYISHRPTPRRRSFGTRNVSANYGYARKYGRSAYSNNGNRNRYDNLIRSSARRYGVDPALVKAIIHTESNFKPYARSHVGAQGLMQLMPGTARDLRVANPWNPAQNIDGGTRYIAQLLRRFNNNAELALAGYNAGPHRQSLREGRIPNIRETRNYVRRVLSRYHSLYKHDPNLRNTSFRNNNFNNGNNSGFKRISYKTGNNYNRGRSNYNGYNRNNGYSNAAFNRLH